MEMGAVELWTPPSGHEAFTRATCNTSTFDTVITHTDGINSWARDVTQLRDLRASFACTHVIKGGFRQIISQQNGHSLSHPDWREYHGAVHTQGLLSWPTMTWQLRRRIGRVKHRWDHHICMIMHKSHFEIDPFGNRPAGLFTGHFGTDNVILMKVGAHDVLYV